MGLSFKTKVNIMRSCEVVIFLILLVYLPGVPPHAKISLPFTVKPTLPFEGPLTLNEKLEPTELWYKGDLHGPEAFVDRDGVLYTNIHGGEIVKLVSEDIVPLAKFGKPCKGFVEEKKCGRLLGMNFGKDGLLYLCDAYYGLYKLDVDTGKSERLVAYKEFIGGHNVTLPNSVVVAESGDVYWTDSSTQFNLENGVFDMFADGSGRLIHYNPKTKDHKVLISNLRFANGVALAHDESFVLVGETFMNRIHRYWLTGAKKGTYEIFIDGLPGMVDNLKSVGKEGFLVPLVLSVDNEHPQILNTLGPHPLIRRFIARILALLDLGFEILHELCPVYYLKWIVHYIGHFESVAFFTSHKRATILLISNDGKIVDSVHSLTGKLSGISEAHIFEDYLYMGSPFNDYVGRIPLSKIGWERLSKPKSITEPIPAMPTPTTHSLPVPKQVVKNQPKAAPVKEAPKRNSDSNRL